tara:strand:- start:2898 stop:3365 length:468 start_codon:yes stop_codon:yes gene_type:complete
MAIRRDTTSIRFAYPDTPEEEYQPQQQQQFMPEDLGMDSLTRKLMSFGPKGPPPGFDPREFKMTGMSKKPSPASAMTPKMFTPEPEPEEKHPYLPGEDYWAFTKRMDKVFKRGALGVPERGDPDFMPTMIDMYAKIPGTEKFKTVDGTTIKRKVY